jgi:hypothetical protein
MKMANQKNDADESRLNLDLFDAKILAKSIKM